MEMGMDDNKTFADFETALNNLKQKDYGWEFEVKEDYIYLPKFDEKFFPDEIAIVGFFRIENEVQSEDLPIVYALRSKSNVRGFLIDMRENEQESERVQAVMKNIKVERDNSLYNLI